MMAKKFLIFLCSGAAKAGNKKLSYRIASMLETIGIGEIGTIQNLSEQHSSLPELQKDMIFINDCRSGCVNVLTHGIGKEKFIYLDVSPYLTVSEFDIDQYIQMEVVPKLNAKWSYRQAESAIG
jgi:uncharacterized metal-binding protein